MTGTARRLIVHAVTSGRLKFSSPISYLPFLPDYCCFCSGVSCSDVLGKKDQDLLID